MYCTLFFIFYHYYVHLHYEIRDWFSPIVWSHTKTQTPQQKLDKTTTTTTTNCNHNYYFSPFLCANEIILNELDSRVYRRVELMLLLLLFSFHLKEKGKKRNKTTLPKYRSWLSWFFLPFLPIFFTYIRFNSFRKWISVWKERKTRHTYTEVLRKSKVILKSKP